MAPCLGRSSAVLWRRRPRPPVRFRAGWSRPCRKSIDGLKAWPPARRRASRAEFSRPGDTGLISSYGGQTGGQRTQSGTDSARPNQHVFAGERKCPRSGRIQIRAYPPDLLRDEEDAGSNPATPTRKHQVRSSVLGRTSALVPFPGLSGEILEKILDTVSRTAPY